MVGDELHGVASLSYHHCITALIMWVRVCPILNGLAQIRNTVRLDSLRCYIICGPLPAYITALRKQDRRSKTDTDHTLFCLRFSSFYTEFRGHDPVRYELSAQVDFVHLPRLQVIFLLLFTVFAATSESWLCVNLFPVMLLDG